MNEWNKVVLEINKLNRLVSQICFLGMMASESERWDITNFVWWVGIGHAGVQVNEPEFKLGYIYG